MKTAIITGADVSALLDKMVLLQDENKRLTEQVAATEAATARKCADAMCGHCASSIPIEELLGGLLHRVGPRSLAVCQATQIRRAHPAAFAQGEGR